MMFFKFLNGSEKEKLDKEIWQNGSVVGSTWKRGHMIKNFFFLMRNSLSFISLFIFLLF